MEVPILLIIIFSVIGSAFFSGMEIAFISANRLSIELSNKEGQISGRILSFFMKRPSRFIGTMLLGNNVALVIYGIQMAILLDPWISQWMPNEVGILLIQTIISTLIILVTAEFMPKAIFRANPNRSLSLFAIPIFIIYWLLWLPMILTIGISESILKAFTKSAFSKEEIAFGRIDLDNYVKESTERANNEEELDHEIQIFQNALEFSKVKARDCMIPRTEIEAMEVDDDIEVMKQRFIETGYSKILVYRDNIDNIIGYVHSYELFKHPEAIKTILWPIFIIPETITAEDVLEKFIKESRGVAVVVDEFGGTSGMLTIEDIIEEIFGEIEDEHDQEEMVQKELRENQYEFSARLEIDDINENYDLKIPESEEYDTLAGFIIHETENIPDQNEVFVIHGFQVEILEKTENKIELVRFTLIDQD